MRDSEIEQWVLNEIKLATDGRLKEVCVWSFDGVVNLKGTVHRRADRLTAEKAAAQARGVVAVINQLNVRRRTLVRRRAGVESPIVSVPSTFHLANLESLRSSPAAS